MLIVMLLQAHDKKGSTTLTSTWPSVRRRRTPRPPGDAREGALSFFGGKQGRLVASLLSTERGRPTCERGWLCLAVSVLI